MSYGLSICWRGPPGSGKRNALQAQLAAWAQAIGQLYVVKRQEWDAPLQGGDGSEDSEEGYDQHGVLRVKVNPAFYRPSEVDILCGNSSKAEKILGWKRNYTFNQLVREMVREDCDIS